MTREIGPLVIAAARDQLPLAALEVVANGVVITDAAGTILWVNAAFTRMTGYGFDEVLGRTPRLLKSGAHPPEFYRDLWEAVTRGEVWTGEMLNRRKDGSTYFEEQTITPVRDRDGTVSRFIAIKQDVTARRAIEEALRQREREWRALIAAAPVAIIVLEAGGRVTTWNRAAAELFGWTEEDARRDARVLETALGDPATYTALLARADAGAAIRDAALSGRKRNGMPVELSVSIAALGGADGAPGHILLVGDVTERNSIAAEKEQMQEQLRQAQKMEAIGRLAGGIAHDFNNLLTVITGRSHLASRRLPAGDPVRLDIEAIEKTSQRAAALTRQLLTFSRQQVLQPRLLDINAVVTGVEALLRRIIGEDVELATVLAPDVGALKADPCQLEQVLLNLAVNARDAMPRGGRLTIETANVDVGPHGARADLGAAPGGYVRLSVTDTGHGMDERTQARAFEPFFTTKEPGKGTGLGLATVHGIVKQTGGHIAVESEAGRGTTFRIYLPRVPGPSSEPPRTPSTSAPRGSETLLLVEDDADVRALAREILEASGYVVLQASAADALALAAATTPIDALVTDVVMPGINGIELGRRVRQLRPDIRVLYVSGYTAHAAEQDALEPDFALLHKPFTVETLTAKIREVLDAPPRQDRRGARGAPSANPARMRRSPRSRTARRRR
jgi:nitrogen fixation negative regulator NifL